MRLVPRPPTAAPGSPSGRSLSMGRPFNASKLPPGHQPTVGLFTAGCSMAKNSTSVFSLITNFSTVAATAGRSFSKLSHMPSCAHWRAGWFPLNRRRPFAAGCCVIWATMTARSGTSTSWMPRSAPSLPSDSSSVARVLLVMPKRVSS